MLWQLSLLLLLQGKAKVLFELLKRELNLFSILLGFFGGDGDCIFHFISNLHLLFCIVFLTKGSTSYLMRLYYLFPPFHHLIAYSSRVLTAVGCSKLTFLQNSEYMLNQKLSSCNILVWDKKTIIVSMCNLGNDMFTQCLLYTTS